MSAWYIKNMGDAMLAGPGLEDIRNSVDAEIKKTVNNEQMAVFIRHESDGHLHCEVKIYFTPAAAIVASAVHATSCARPAPEGLDLLAGHPQAWALFKQ